MKQVYRVYHREELVASFDDPISATAYMAEFSTPQYLLKGVPLQVEEPEELGFTISIWDYVLRKLKHIRVTWDSKISDAYKSVGIPVSGSTMICINGSYLKPEQFDMTWKDIRGFLQQFSADADALVYMVVDNHRMLPDTV